MEDEKTEKWSAILKDALTVPGQLHQAYSNFHNYSLRNCFLAMGQCMARNIPIGPISSYRGWLKLGRHVKKGEKAISMLMPFTFKKKMEDGTEEVVAYFKPKNFWFVLSQTEGEEYQSKPLPNWDKEKALANLKIEEIPFDMVDGNTMGYASENKIAINPLNPMKEKTLFHEIAHCLMHTGESKETETLTRNQREMEAESVALIVCESLGLHDSASNSRAYIQGWYGEGNTVSEKEAGKIFSVADKILSSGMPKKETDQE